MRSSLSGVNRGVLMAWLALAACAGAPRAPAHPEGPPRNSPRKTELDPALELAAELPAGADRCVVVRPARVPAARRSLLSRISQAEPLAWLAELEIEAYASAQRDSRDGASAHVTLLRVNAPGDEVRRVLDARSGLALHWDADARGCSPAECPVRARFVRAQVVSIERGPFVPQARGGVEAQCLRMAERSPSATEISVTRNRAFGAFRFGGLPLRASAELRASPAGLQVERVDRMQTPEDAERVLLEGIVPEAMLPRGSGIGVGQNAQRTRVDAAVHTRFELQWADLELARGDEARLQAAARDADALAATHPAEGRPSHAGSSEPGSREDVLAELGYRLELIGQASGEPRRVHAHAARALLEQALARNPDDEGLALMLVELLLLEALDPAAARALVERYAARPGASRGWAVLDRHSAALVGPSVLAEALVRQRVVDRRRARAVAQAIVTRMREGMSFERAERATTESAR